MSANFTEKISLTDLRNRPITCTNKKETALAYHNIGIDLDCDFNKESLVSVEELGIAARSAYVSPYGPYKKAFANALPKVYVRETVAKMLIECNKILREYAVEILALDGYRSVDLQKELWQYFIDRGKELLKTPTEEDLIKFAGTYSSNPSSYDPNNFRTWPIHNTGGAIDVTLRSIESKKELFFCSYFDQADPISVTRYFEKENLDDSQKEAQGNRRLLCHAMQEVGFINYPHEWWHYDFGTQMWVMNGGNNAKAYYGRSQLKL